LTATCRKFRTASPCKLRQAIENPFLKPTVIQAGSLARLCSSSEKNLPDPLNFQQQQSAPQRALQQAIVLQQTMTRLNNQPGQSELSQLNAIQSALQITSSLQTAAQIQNGPLTTTQIQTLFREQSSLIGVLASPPPQLSIPGQGR
jgi:hypothetical protein